MITSYESYSERRDGLGMTDYRVSKETGISRSTFSQWHKGEIKPSKSTLERIDRFFTNVENSLPFHPNQKDFNQKAKDSIDKLIEAEPHITSYDIMLDNGLVIELSKDQYDRLRRAIQYFVHAWAKSEVVNYEWEEKK